MNCPHCGKNIDSVFKEIGSKGGSKSKRFLSAEDAKKMVQIREKKRREYMRAIRGERQHLLTAIGLHWLDSRQVSTAQEARLKIKELFRSSPIEEIRDYHRQYCKKDKGE